MDAVRFGRWLAERRQACGWKSQRACAEAVVCDPLVAGNRVTENFLARLEAGQLAHPFRGGVRARVLALAAFLSATPRDLRRFLRAAGLAHLTTGEATTLDRLFDHAVSHAASGPLLLPPRPAHLLGRDQALADLHDMVQATAVGVCAITGMPGVGKSALAVEALHRLSGNAATHGARFPVGIVAVTCAGRTGTEGLIALLDEIAAIFTLSGAPGTSIGDQPMVGRDHSGTMHRARTALARREVLLLLDDVDPRLPLRQMLDALLAGARPTMSGGEAQPRRVILLTSRHIPSPHLLAGHLHLPPLDPASAVDLVRALLGRALTRAEAGQVGRLCAALGYLPLAIEGAVSLASAGGMPLALLAARAQRRPLDLVSDGDAETQRRLSEALAALPRGQSDNLLRVTALAASSFSLDAAVAVQPGCAEDREAANDLSLDALAGTAADLASLARHSLLEPAPNRMCDDRNIPIESLGATTRYQIHPLIRHFAHLRFAGLDPDAAAGALGNVERYAVEYVARWHGDVPRLELEHEVLLAALADAVRHERTVTVVDMVSGLLAVVARPLFSAHAKSVLMRGIRASRELRDRRHLDLFLDRLGVLAYYRGDLACAYRIWDEGQAVAREIGQAAVPEKHLRNLAMAAFAEGDHRRGARLSAAFVERAAHGESIINLCMGTMMRGYAARMASDPDGAARALSGSLALVAHLPATSLHATIRFFVNEAESELTRVQGDYAQATARTEASIARGWAGADPYLAADHLLDHAIFAHTQGVLDDARTFAVRAAAHAAALGARHLGARAQVLLAQLPT